MKTIFVLNNRKFVAVEGVECHEKIKPLFGSLNSFKTNNPFIMFAKKIPCKYFNFYRIISELWTGCPNLGPFTLQICHSLQNLLHCAAVCFSLYQIFSMCQVSVPYMEMINKKYLIKPKNSKMIIFMRGGILSFSIHITYKFKFWHI